VIDLALALRTAENAARLAGERIMQDFGKEVAFEQKGDISDRVTKIDCDAQRIIHEVIEGVFPDHAFLEEEGEGDPEHRDALWIVDPLDGTSNFIQGIEHMGVSIALQVRGEIEVGVLHFPAQGRTYTAVRGKGAYCNGRRIAVRDCASLAEACVAEIFSDRDHRGKPVRYPPVRVYRKFGSAITSLAYLAAGNLHAVALRCYLWDAAAAALLITEAGGKVRVQLDDPSNLRSPLSCIAAVPGVFDAFSDLIDRKYS
jgi:myo-inositol-1(or 4)-monophosphatase